MKKLLMVCGVAAMMFGATSCNKTSSSDNANQGFGDSLSLAMGSAQGSRLLSEYMTLPEEQQANYKKDDILRGLKQALMTDTTQQGYLTGFQFGMQLFGQILRYEEAGVPIDRNKLYEAYAKAFSADSVDSDQMRELQTEFQALAQQAQQKMMEYYQAQEEAAKAAKENSPEAKENKEKGAAYIQDAIKNDPSIKTTESGLAYKVINEGTGEAIGRTGSAVVKYKGQLIDGTVFDSNDEGATLSPRGTVPGFAEGLAMMKKGAKYVLYIPGELAYGVDGQPQAGIGPNATLVFEVEAVEVTPGK